MVKSAIEGKVALVTGASKGIGRGCAIRLAEMGVKVAVNYNSSPKAAEEAVETIKGIGGEAFAVQADVSKVEQVNAMVDRVQKDWGAVDILVNNAGIIDDGLLIRMTDEQWRRVIGTNLDGTFYCSRAVIRKMLSKRWGRIINIASVVGLRGNPGQTNYTASKAGIIGFTKALAKEVATRNITVNCVTPGYLETETTSVLTEAQRSHWLSVIPQCHFGEIDDIAYLVCYLADEKAKYMTGQIISVDGGMAV